MKDLIQCKYCLRVFKRKDKKLEQEKDKKFLKKYNKKDKDEDPCPKCHVWTG